MSCAFTHPISVPIPQALAFYHISHNHGSDGDWAKMDEWIEDKGIEHVIKQLVKTEKMNHLVGIGDKKPDEEITSWWTKQLTKGGRVLL